MTKSAAHDVEKIQTGIFILHGVGRSRSRSDSLRGDAGAIGIEIARGIAHEKSPIPQDISYLKDFHLLPLSPVNNRV
ncbi:MULTISPECIES: hypothetical protein [Aphanizomenonaceae]|uniref:Uncharacterized protein n=1 Tax=Dolichospermum heterosporum TAC447 TaxID=747523 RepID=A0ABY5LXB7_9CYAN|nr:MULTISPECIES: hypothetical protein [Aphanizomenonaceae]MBE9259837.1 hypothetical protein [Dolichospermum sp. LEGE 00246]MDK2412568.1 hypothetical protein [Aphanizomenon sp. 202]MDK2462770.1 hypothetical protein [Aphanizomenon sp. PH219]UUO15649.1 hypothetical protein NG743_00880 [Dolichospermum heterosporum TAC447]